MNNSSHFDFIIIGAGAAGLMLADAMISDDFFKGKSILLLDRDTKQNNDRTWCFWEKGEGQFDAIVHKKWNHIFFGGKQFSNRFNINPYTYKMVRGIDFYNSLLQRIEAHPGIAFKQAEIHDVSDDGKIVKVSTSHETYLGVKVFNSIFNYRMAKHQEKYPVLQQHFIGWFVKTPKPVFDADQATYMDFSIEQKGNTRFMYVLPTSENEALIEHTLFSEDLLPKEEYETAIKEYLQKELDTTDYEIIETEMGSIPMTCYDFKEHHTQNMRYIGTAGGWAKPSTGYTFASTARKIPVLLEYIKTGKPLNSLGFKNRFWFYDLLFLDVLYKDNSKGYHIFETLFKNRNPKLIFKFLDEQTNLWEDIKYISGCPKRTFIKALFRRLF
ncbi:lycopene cyclase [Maribacter algarum]|uniref:Lycopene cyclase n=1 Tax=Maribacter algarum (ex Zhang et al. 2020) TaxID=2578118 RepID=A0A5S3PUM0_9FLAO|nr:lycopene cyclase family protein [Maribacter algarum]TMM58685.1 lycopene cyclase [Maribacter algarum]